MLKQDCSSALGSSGKLAGSAHPGGHGCVCVCSVSYQCALLHMKRYLPGR